MPHTIPIQPCSFSALVMLTAPCNSYILLCTICYISSVLLILCPLISRLVCCKLDEPEINDIQYTNPWRSGYKTPTYNQNDGTCLRVAIFGSAIPVFIPSFYQNHCYRHPYISISLLTTCADIARLNHTRAPQNSVNLSVAFVLLFTYHNSHSTSLCISQKCNLHSDLISKLWPIALESLGKRQYLRRMRDLHVRHVCEKQVSVPRLEIGHHRSHP